jgi:hypothetical protein
MSHDEHLQRQAREWAKQYPSAPKATEYEVPNYHDRTVANNEIDRVREEQSRAAKKTS